MKRSGSFMVGLLLALGLASGVASAADTYTAPQAGQIKIDGNVQDWLGVAGVTLTDPAGIVEPATLYAQWDSNALYFLVVAEDEAQVNAATGSSIWQGDCLQISLDTANNKNAYGYDDNDYEFGWALTNNGLEQTQWHTATGVTYDPSTIDFAVTHVDADKNGKAATVYEIAIPAAQVAPMALQQGTVVGFDYLLNDDDGSGRQAADWTGGIGTSKDPSLYNDLKLG